MFRYYMKLGMLSIRRNPILSALMVAAIAIGIGAVLAVGLNIWMVQTFSFAPICWYLIPVAMFVLWLVGQLAVYGPARRASCSIDS